MTDIKEQPGRRNNGFAMLALVGLMLVAEVAMIVTGVRQEQPWWLAAILPLALIMLLTLCGFLIVQPNHSKVLIFFGTYRGTVRNVGFGWVNPFTIRKSISLRVNNFNSETIKVNDSHGNPIEIAAVVVWRVVDTARALFQVEKYEEFVKIQSETAIRIMASSHPYDTNEGEAISLRGSPHEIAEDLKKELQKRLDDAGLEVLESRISHLAYAQEIAQAMLRRQQAQAIIAARKKIVEGAVGMVRDALHMLSEQGIVEFDNDKKAAMVNNLMVALVSESEATPVINTGTIYQ